MLTIQYGTIPAFNQSDHYLPLVRVIEDDKWVNEEINGLWDYKTQEQAEVRAFARAAEMVTLSTHKWDVNALYPSDVDYDIVPFVSIDHSRPRAGDAVRLTHKWSIAEAGDYGILGGVVRSDSEELSITFRPSIYYNGQYCSCSGGPGTFAQSIHLLTPTEETKRVTCWMFHKDMQGAGRGIYFYRTVRVWEWDGKNDY